MEANREYAGRLREVVNEIITRNPGIDSPYLKRNQSPIKVSIVFCSDMGLCGAYNMNILRYCRQELTNEDPVILIGTSLFRMMKEEGFRVVNPQPISSDAVTPQSIRENVESAMQYYFSGQVGVLQVIRTRFVNTMNFVPETLQILPGSAELEKEPEGMLKRIRMALERGKASLEEQGFFDEDSIGEFWQIFETRPYLRLKDQYVVSLAEFGMLRMAVREAEEIIRLNTQDNLGVRFTLMHLYAALEDAKSAEDLLKQYSEHDEGQMMLPLTLLYYKLGDTDKAEKALRRLTRINKETRQFIRDVRSDNLDRKLETIRNRGGYSPFTEEELIMAYSENEDVYHSAPLFFRWLSRTLKM
jgi:tetratricopeptide (TPR) repeat protein